MIVTITPNPAVDLTLRPDALIAGATHVIPAAGRRAGGKGVNVARVLAQLGRPHEAVVPVGDADADWFRADLAGVRCRLVPYRGETRRTYAIAPAEGGRTSILLERGAPRTAADGDALLRTAAEAAGSATVLTVSGSVPPDEPPTGSPDGVVAALVRLGRDAGIPVIADASGPSLLAAAGSGADVLKPNRDELREATGEEDPIDGARSLQRRGAGLVVVSLGEEGMLGVPADPRAPIVRARLGRVLHGNPTGAGDAAVAAIASCLTAGATPSADLPDMLRLAVSWSAAAVLAPLAGAVDPCHAELLPEVELSRG
jgi:1-phosphofructokinase family hexose kinase